MKIALTGGPSAGKTTIAHALQKQLPYVKVVPEAASILFQGGFPRGTDKHSTQCLQRAIYHIQVEVEKLYEHKYPKDIILCDRGTLDGAAYWNGPIKGFFDSVKSNSKLENNRYDWVIHLDTAAQLNYDTSNPHRKEDYSSALKLNKKIKTAWSNHPNRIIVSNNRLFFTKIEIVLKIVKCIFAGLSKNEIDLEIEKLNKELKALSEGTSNE